MKKILLPLLALMAALQFGPARASSEGIPWDKFPTKRITDVAALQHGAKLFANYCLNCHAASYVRFNRLRDIGLTEPQIKDNLIFTGAKVGDLMTVAMSTKDAKDWFGGAPPDLTLVARSRADAAKGSGSDYLYTYLRTFYRDDSKLTGWDNLAFPTVAMPNVLWELQGQQRALFTEHKDPHDPSQTVRVFTGFEQISPGKMTPAQYNTAVADLVAFMQWMAEPARDQRVRVGVWVMLFLGVLTFIVWRLNAAFWKDVK